MIFFPLAIAAGVIAARRWSLLAALALGAALFAVAVLVASKLQGFAPSPRDLIWLGLTWAATAASARFRRRAAD